MESDSLMRLEVRLSTVNIALTGLVADADRKEILAAGADAYITKPFPMADLIKGLEGRRKAKKVHWSA